MREPDVNRIRRLDERAIRAAAERLLAESHPAGEPPVPVDLVVERQGIDIVPLPGLEESFGVVGFTSLDLSTIYVDAAVFQRQENRYRFALAHELGHVRLHAELFLGLHARLRKKLGGRGAGLQEWLTFHESLKDASGGSLEWQADRFAGFFLVPASALKGRFEKSPAHARKLIGDAVGRGIARKQVLDWAWDELARRVAPSFGVSRDVVLRRLATEKFSPAGL
jgi:Zn-dependent peptidase ImmA (M78 family)